MKTNKLVVFALAIGVLFTSCSSDNDDDIEALPQGDYDNGILISHEGNFFKGNASVSYVSDDFLTVENNVFNTINNTLLGDTAQSMAFDGDLAYVVLNVSNKIEVINRYSFESIATINTNLNNPRYMAVLNGKGYVTNWGDGGDATDDYITVIDLSTNTVSGTISVDEGPEQILMKDDMLYVSHKGGYSVNNIVSVIDPTDNSVETIEVSDAPGEMAIDSNGNLVVFCSGGNQYWLPDFVETKAAIVKINTASGTVISTLEFESGVHPSLMAHDDDELYYVLNGEVFELDDDDTTLPTTAILDVSSIAAYGMSVDDDTLYLLDSDFVDESDLLIYDLDTVSLSNTIELSIGASRVYFN